MMHMSVGLHAHVLIDTHRAAGAHAPQIVALQVDQHDVFGAFLLVVQERSDQRGITLRSRAARAGPCDRPGRNGVAADRYQPFGRGAQAMRSPRRAAAQRTDWDWWCAGAGKCSQGRRAASLCPASCATDWSGTHRPPRCTPGRGGPIRERCRARPLRSEMLRSAAAAPRAARAHVRRNRRAGTRMPGSATTQAWPVARSRIQAAGARIAKATTGSGLGGSRRRGSISEATSYPR